MNDQVTPHETAEILRLAERCLDLEGDFVELGCYRGDTSVLLGKLLAQKTSGYPDRSEPSRNLELAACGKPVENLCKKSNSLCEKCQNLCKNPSKVVEKPCKTHYQSENDKGKRLWLYDSFAGLPAKTSADQSGAGQNFQKGELFVTKRAVVEKIRQHGLKNVIVKKAWFADLTDEDLPAKIAFAFLDGDLYESIKVSLKLVVPRLAKQGIIVVHDYNNPQLPGSARAVDEFLHTHPVYRLQQKHSLAILQVARSRASRARN